MKYGSSYHRWGFLCERHPQTSRGLKLGIAGGALELR